MRLFLLALIVSCATTPPPKRVRLTYIRCYSAGVVIYSGEVLGEFFRVKGYLHFMSAQTGYRYQIPERLCVVRFEK